MPTERPKRRLLMDPASVSRRAKYKAEIENKAHLKADLEQNIKDRQREAEERKRRLEMGLPSRSPSPPRRPRKTPVWPTPENMAALELHKRRMSESQNKGANSNSRDIEVIDITSDDPEVIEISSDSQSEAPDVSNDKTIERLGSSESEMMTSIERSFSNQGGSKSRSRSPRQPLAGPSNLPMEFCELAEAELSKKGRTLAFIAENKFANIFTGVRNEDFVNEEEVEGLEDEHVDDEFLLSNGESDSEEDSKMFADDIKMVLEEKKPLLGKLSFVPAYEKPPTWLPLEPSHRHHPSGVKDEEIINDLKKEEVTEDMHIEEDLTERSQPALAGDVPRPKRPVDPTGTHRYPTPPPFECLEGPSAVFPFITPDTYSCRPGGPKIYDILNELSLEEFGPLKWSLIEAEEEIFELPDVRDEDKVMQVLWNRFSALHRNEFVNDHMDGMRLFINKYWRWIHRAAGLSALRIFLLVMGKNRFLSAANVGSILVQYRELVGMSMWLPT